MSGLVIIIVLALVGAMLTAALRLDSITVVQYYIDTQVIKRCNKRATIINNNIEGGIERYAKTVLK